MDEDTSYIEDKYYTKSRVVDDTTSYKNDEPVGYQQTQQYDTGEPVGFNPYNNY